MSHIWSSVCINICLLSLGFKIKLIDIAANAKASNSSLWACELTTHSTHTHIHSKRKEGSSFFLVAIAHSCCLARFYSCAEFNCQNKNLKKSLLAFFLYILNPQFLWPLQSLVCFGCFGWVRTCIRMQRLSCTCSTGHTYNNTPSNLLTLISRVWVGHYERLLSWFHSLFRVGVCVHECIEKRQVERTIPTHTHYVHMHTSTCTHTLSLDQISVIHVHPWGAARADRDICIPNSLHPTTTSIIPPSPCQLGPPGPGIGGTGSLLQTCTHTQAHARSRRP